MSLSNSVCALFKRNCLGLQKFLPPPQSLLFFSARSYGTYFVALVPRTGGPVVGLGLLTPKISLLIFYPLYMDVGLACFTSLPFLPVWMDVVSLIP